MFLPCALTRNPLQFAVFPNDLWYLGLDFVIGKLYANSLLATLNVRRSLSGGSSAGVESTSISLQGVRPSATQTANMMTSMSKVSLPHTATRLYRR